MESPPYYLDQPASHGDDAESVEEVYEHESWISEYLAGTGHDLVAEVSEDYFEDAFNLTGLGVLVPEYHEALEMILD